jgi:hypothetical protein
MTDEDKDARIKELEERNKAFEERIKALELKTQPPPKIAVAQPLQGISATERIAIDNMRAPQNVLDGMAAAVGDDVVRQITDDARRKR